MHTTAIAKIEWLRAGNLRLCFVTREAEIAGAEGWQPLPLTPSEFRLVTYFALHAGEVLSRERLLGDIWGPRASRMSVRAIDVHICQLRKKIPSSACRIDAIYGAGYRFDDGRRPETGS
jgi:DNA-binding response OmpR family regulator